MTDVVSGTPKQVTAGTHRAIPEAETLKRIGPIAASAGITRVANLTGLDEVGIPVVAVMRPEARSLTVTQGKGLTLTAAKASGLMEAIEQHHAERILLPLRLASHREHSELRTVVDLGQLPGQRTPLDGFAPLLWIDAVSARSGRTVAVPFALVTLDLRPPLALGHEIFPMNSNGLASGNVLAEAVAHGLWEVIERDATTLFYRRSQSEQSRRRLRLDTIDSDDARVLLAAFERAGVGVALWDITSDLQVPAFFCSTVEKDLDVFRRVGVARGYGCHPDRSVAVCRALCEAAQTRITRIAGSRDDLRHGDFLALQEPGSILRHQAQLAEPERRDFLEVPNHWHSTIEADLAWASERFDRVGLPEFLYVDISPRDGSVHVARVIAPGLEGPAEVPGYAPGPRASALEQG